MKMKAASSCVPNLTATAIRLCAAWLQTHALRSTSRGHLRRGAAPNQPTCSLAATAVGSSQPWQPRVLRQSLRKKQVYEAHLAEAHRCLSNSPPSYLPNPPPPQTQMSTVAKHREWSVKFAEWRQVKAEPDGVSRWCPSETKMQKGFTHFTCCALLRNPGSAPNT